MSFKYNEDALLAEPRDYISGTYGQHYSAGNDAIQTLDLIEACGDAEAFCRSNILKYASPLRQERNCTSGHYQDPALRSSPSSLL